MLGNYSPKKISVVVGLVPLIMFSDNSMVELTEEDDDFKLYKGIDGTFSRALNPGSVVMCKISLQQTSPSNDHLTALRNADKASGLFPFPVAVKDLNGTSLHSASHCFFKKGAGKKYGSAVQAVDWEIYMPNAISYNGGNVVFGI